MQKQNRAFGRGAAGREDRWASELGRGEGQCHGGCRGTGTQRVRRCRCDPICSHIQSCRIGNSGKEFCAEWDSYSRL